MPCDNKNMERAACVRFNAARSRRLPSCLFTRRDWPLRHRRELRDAIVPGAGENRLKNHCVHRSPVRTLAINLTKIHSYCTSYLTMVASCWSAKFRMTRRHRKNSPASRSQSKNNRIKLFKISNIEKKISDHEIFLALPSRRTLNQSRLRNPGRYIAVWEALMVFTVFIFVIWYNPI